MTAKKRGRPPKVGTLKNPPAYIKNRIRARGGRRSEYWQSIIQDLTRGIDNIEPYRKKFRITFPEAAVLLNGPCEVITEADILAVDARLPSMRELGRDGGLAKGKSTPAWQHVAEESIHKYSGHSTSRAAELTLSSWPQDRGNAPSKRTLRRFFVAKK
jgi:hypothetical protein